MTETTRVTEALLLAAGMGSRLQPLTLETPKCLTLVGGIPVIERLVDNLRAQGIKRLIVVLGHMERRIKNFLQKCAPDMQIDYIVNPNYRTTNNIYSLWLARHQVKGPFLLVEGDLIFESWMLDEMLEPNKIGISEIRPRMNGTMVELGAGPEINFIHVGYENIDLSWYKTVNIYSLALSSWKKVEKVLNRFILENRIDEYYESVFSEMVADGTLSFDPVFFDPANWYEIDTNADLERAERIFSERATHFQAFPVSPNKVFPSG